MKLFIADGKCYRNDKFSKPKLSLSDRNYLRKETTYRDNSWQFFSQIENDFRLLHKPH